LNEDSDESNQSVDEEPMSKLESGYARCLNKKTRQQIGVLKEQYSTINANIRDVASIKFAENVKIAPEADEASLKKLAGEIQELEIAAANVAAAHTILQQKHVQTVKKQQLKEEKASSETTKKLCNEKSNIILNKKSQLAKVLRELEEENQKTLNSRKELIEINKEIHELWVQRDGDQSQINNRKDKDLPTSIVDMQEKQTNCKGKVQVMAHLSESLIGLMSSQWGRDKYLMEDLTDCNIVRDNIHDDRAIVQQLGPRLYPKLVTRELIEKTPYDREAYLKSREDFYSRRSGGRKANESMQRRSNESTFTFRRSNESAL